MMWRKIRSLIQAELSGENDPDCIAGTIPRDIIEFVEKVRIIKGKPFSFKDREYLYEIYRDTANDNYIVKGRQTEMTEFAINVLFFHLLTHPGTVGLYVSDRDKHVKIFSRDRLRKEAIGKSKILKSYVVKGGGKGYVAFTNGSVLHMISGWGDFEEARSISVDFAVIDEIQSLNATAIPVLRESLSKSEHRRLWVIGTGSDYGDDWWKLWHDGTQKEWDVQTKKWIAKNPSSEYSSYRISQYMVPGISHEEIEKKKRGSIPRYVKTEIEGMWHESATRPLNREHMMRLFDRNLGVTHPEDVDHTLPVFMGVDWGGGTQAFTVVWIWQLVNEAVPRFKVLNVIKIDDQSTEVQANKVIELMLKYQVEQCVMDSGGGKRQVEKMFERFGSKVCTCTYHHDLVKPYKYIPKEKRVLADRTWIIEVIIDLIKRPESSLIYQDGIPRLHMPYQQPEQIEWIIENFTCIKAETANAQSRSYVKYVHSDETNDDALHAACYAYLAWGVSQGNKWFWVSW